MKKFVLTTHSESGDDYTYFIEHNKNPTHKELESFLKIHACDKDDDGDVYEHVRSCIEIKEYKTIPTKNKKL